MYLFQKYRKQQNNSYIYIKIDIFTGDILYKIPYYALITYIDDEVYHINKNHLNKNYCVGSLLNYPITESIPNTNFITNAKLGKCYKFKDRLIIIHKCRIWSWLNCNAKWSYSKKFYHNIFTHCLDDMSKYLFLVVKCDKDCYIKIFDRHILDVVSTIKINDIAINNKIIESKCLNLNKEKVVYMIMFYSSTLLYIIDIKHGIVTYVSEIEATAILRVDDNRFIVRGKDTVLYNCCNSLKQQCTEWVNACDDISF